MDLATLLLQQFKLKTRSVENPLLTALGAATLRVFSNNPNRLAWLFINLSANIIYLGLANDVSATKGIVVVPNGGVASMVWDEDFNMVGWDIWGIAPAGASNCYSVEVVTQ